MTGEERKETAGKAAGGKEERKEGALSLGMSVSFSARPVAPGVAAAERARVDVRGPGASRRDEGEAARAAEGRGGLRGEEQERRPLSPEAREQMKRELKAQLRAYVDALKKQMLEKKEGEKPDLEEAMARAEMEAARVLAERKRQQLAGKRAEEETVVKNGVEDRTAEGVADARAAAAGARAETAQAGKEAAPVRDVMDVASRTAGETPAEADTAAVAEEKEGPAEVSRESREGADEAHVSAIPKEELDRLTRDIIAALKTVYDPEIPVDIYELGLVYRIDISDDRVITIDMTLTAPGCPVAGDMPGWVKKAVSEVEGVKEVKVNLVFDPPWDMSRMSDEARLALNMF